MEKQFLKIKPSYKKEIVWIEDAPYLAHFNRGEWKDKKYVFIGDVGMGFNVPCIEYLVDQNLYYDEIKPEILQKTLLDNYFGYDFVIKFLFAGREIYKNLSFRIIRTFRGDLRYEGSCSLFEFLDKSSFEEILKLEAESYEENKRKIEEEKENEYRKAREKERLLKIEEEERIKKQKLLDEELEKNISLINIKVLNAIKYPVFFRACQGFLDNESDKTRKKLMAACASYNFFENHEMEYFMKNARKILLKIIKEHEAISKNSSHLSASSI